MGIHINHLLRSVPSTLNPLYHMWEQMEQVDSTCWSSQETGTRWPNEAPGRHQGGRKGPFGQPSVAGVGSNPKHSVWQKRVVLFMAEAGSFGCSLRVQDGHRYVNGGFDLVGSQSIVYRICGHPSDGSNGDTGG